MSKTATTATSGSLTKEANTGPATSQNPTQRPSGAVWPWSVIGLGLITLFFNNWIVWLSSPDFGPIDPGPDPYDHKLFMRVTEFTSFGVFLFIGYFTVIKPYTRDGQLGVDGKLFIGGVFASTLDIMFAVFNPTWAMNAHMITSYGSWANSIPGFPAPGADKIPWGLMFCVPTYVYLGVGAGTVGCGIMGSLRSRFPSISDAACYGVAHVLYMTAYTVFAFIMMRKEIYVFVSVLKSLSIWYGEQHQFPLYEPWFISMYCLGYTWMRETVDSRGRCAVDRDVDRLPISNFQKELLSFLALIGWAGATTMFGYMVPFSWMGMLGDSHPALPSYLQSGLYCGQPGGPICPNQLLSSIE